MKTTTFLTGTVAGAMKLFEYYRNGPVAMHKLQPGFIFQQCVDAVLEKQGISTVECGLGDHCLIDAGLALQLKTTVQDTHDDRIIFCRSSLKGRSAAEQKSLRINDVESRILDMFGQTGTSQLVLVHVNLFNKNVKIFQLHDGNGVVGNWLKPENVVTPFKQTHFWVKTRHMIELA